MASGSSVEWLVLYCFVGKPSADKGFFHVVQPQPPARVLFLAL